MVVAKFKISQKYQQQHEVVQFIWCALLALMERRNEEVFGNISSELNIITESFSFYHNFMQAMDTHNLETVKRKNGIPSTSACQLSQEGTIKINKNASID